MTRVSHDQPWMSLDADLAPRLDDGNEPECQEEKPAVSLSRRGFLKALGIGGAMTLAACERLPTRKAVPYLTPPEEITPGVPVRYASTCMACPAACGLLVTARDGRPVKLEGRREHALSRGGLCALGQADLRGLYDSARLAGPTLHGKRVPWSQVDAAVRAGLAGSTGGLFFLAPTLVSPTARQAVQALLSPYGGTLVEWDPGADSPGAILQAYESLDGVRRLPYLEIASADLLVVLGADLLGAGWDPVAHTAAYAGRKKAHATRGAFRHVQIEANLSLTGAVADERVLATSAERTHGALWLLRNIAERSHRPEAAVARAALASPSSPPLPIFEALADELWAARGRSLVVSGSDDPVEQVAVALLNRFLENEGKTLDLERPSRVRRGTPRDVDDFVDRLLAGKVKGVILWDRDPVDELPDGDALGAALSKVPLSVAITSRPTASAAACGIVAASHHALEQWSDAEPREGVLTLAQPTVQPLLGTRHPLECLLAWSGARDTDPRRALMASWRKNVYHAGALISFETFWQKSVSFGHPPAGARGFGAPLAVPAALAAPAPETLAGPAAADLASRYARLLSPAPGDEAHLQVDLCGEVGTRDGRGTSNPWLRELPDPVTRVSWSACARIAPSLARDLGIRDGAVVSITVDDRSVELPVRVLPGQHPRVIGVPLGYGKMDGDGGVATRNGVRLARRSGGRFQLRGLAASVTTLSQHEALPIVQGHARTEGRPVVFQVRTPDEPVPPPHAGGRSLWASRPVSSPKWHMTINLDACTGCSSCVVACQAENNLPVVGPDEIRAHRDMHWIRIDRYFVGDENHPDVLFEPMLCSQCDNAPCETVCPVVATVHSHDGLNQQIYNRCVGTRYCANNCPYKVRRFNWFQYDRGGELERMVLNPDVTVRDRGVMEKCTFCVQRIQLARIESRHGEFREPMTACQQSCPAGAISFGDVTDESSDVAKNRKTPRAFRVLADLGVEPQITYLARVRNRKGDKA